MRNGTPEQKDKWKDEYILPVVRAEATASLGISEPGAGSDTGGVQTTAFLEGNYWVINGTKAFISNAGLENNRYVSVLCLTNRTKISQFQFVQAMLVDMALELELSRLLRDKTALSIDEGRYDAKLSSIVKYFCCESAQRAADQTIQIYGAMGLMDECPAARYYRQIRPFTIADGTAEIQKWVIARELGC